METCLLKVDVDEFILVELSFYILERFVSQLRRMQAMAEAKLIDLIERQIKVEDSFVKTADHLMGMLGSASMKLLIMGLKKDSEKHGIILRGILDGIKRQKSLVTWNMEDADYVDKAVLSKELKHHIEIEVTMYNLVMAEVKETTDEGVKLLLGQIAADEEKHHKILEDIMAQAYKLKP